MLMPQSGVLKLTILQFRCPVVPPGGNVPDQTTFTLLDPFFVLITAGSSSSVQSQSSSSAVICVMLKFRLFRTDSQVFPSLS